MRIKGQQDSKLTINQKHLQKYNELKKQQHLIFSNSFRRYVIRLINYSRKVLKLLI